MIIETPYKAGDTISIKTAAGEELVARLVEEKIGKIVVSKPLAIMATPNGMGLGPFMFTVSPDAKIELNTNAVLAIVKTEANMAKQYITSTTGVVV